MARSLLLCIVAVCSLVSACDGDSRPHTTGPIDRTGDSAGAGDTFGGDPASGDPAAGDPNGGDPAFGDAIGGDPVVGDPNGGDPAAGDAIGGDPSTAAGPTACATTDDCTGTDECIGLGCVSRVTDLEAYVADTSTRLASYWWSLQLPATFDPPERCCFDYNGDPQALPDDALGALLGLLASFSGAANVNDYPAAIDSGLLVRAIDWRGHPGLPADGSVWFSLFEGELHGDGAGGVVDLAGRRAGDSHLLVNRTSFISHGARWQFNLGQINAGIVTARGNGFRVPVNLFGMPLLVELHDARLQANVRLDASPTAPCRGLCTVDEPRGSGAQAYLAGGAKLGGLLALADLLDGMDTRYRGCACAGVDPGLQVIAYAVDPVGGVFDVSCTTNIGVQPTSCDSADPCDAISTTCSFIGFIANVADVDADADDVNDSLSAGFRVAWSGTHFDGLAGVPCGVDICSGAEVCTDMGGGSMQCRCGGAAACSDVGFICRDGGAGVVCACIEGAGGDTACGGAPLACVGGACVDTDSSEQFCGTARIACDVGEVCVVGTCTCGADPTNGAGGAVCSGQSVCTETSVGSGVYTCVCLPASCAEQSITCGLVSDGCAATLDCDNGVQDGDESDVDCGGGCARLCAAGSACFSEEDCVADDCVDEVCCDSACVGACEACNLVAAGCGNGSDCESGICTAGLCEAKSCTLAGDCASLRCDATSSTCETVGLCSPLPMAETPEGECAGDYACDGSRACLDICFGDGECAVGRVCSAGNCQ